METKPIFSARSFQFGIISPIQRRHLNLATFGTMSQGLISFSESFGQRKYDMDLCGLSLSSCSSPDTSASLTLGHSLLFSSNDNLSFQVRTFICCYVKRTVIFFPIRMSHHSNINALFSRCKVVMYLIPLHYSLQHLCLINRILGTCLLIPRTYSSLQGVL